VPTAHAFAAAGTPPARTELATMTGFLGRPLPAGKVIVLGEGMIDLFPCGRAELGGPSMNVAVHLAQLGVPVALVTRVGNDAPGRLTRDRLACAGVDVSLLQVDEERATGTTTVTFPGGDEYAPCYEDSQNAAWERIEMTPAIEDALQQASALVYGTLTLATEAGGESFLRAIDAAPEGVLRVCDPNLRVGVDSACDDAALLTAIRAADLIKMSREDARLMQERLGVADAVGMLAAGDPALPGDRGQRLLVVTEEVGSQFIVGESGLSFDGVPAMPCGDAAGNGVGCGDAYNAAMLHGLVEGWPYAQVGRFASLYAALVAGSPVATPVFEAGRIEALRSAVAADR
jgi:fructokinase